MSEVPKADPIHELLPWYVAGTLARVEEEAFRAHLTACRPCRDELEVLGSLKAEIDRHGADFLREHPPAERLVAAVRGELNADEQTEVRRHLALCSTCASEASWVRGDAVAQPGAGRHPATQATPQTAARTPPPARPSRPWVWALAAAAIVFALMLPMSLRGLSISDETGIPASIFIAAPERAGQARAFSVADDETAVNLMFEIDLAATSFPAAFRLLDANGRILRERPSFRRRDLADGIYLNVPCPRSVCPDGAYAGVIQPAPAAGEMDIRIPFELTSD